MRKRIRNYNGLYLLSKYIFNLREIRMISLVWYGQLNANRSKMNTVKNYLKIIGYLLAGGMISHFMVTPYLQGDFNDELYSISSFFGQEDVFDEVLEEEKLKRIEQNIHRHIFNEFHREFGSDAILKYEEFMRKHYANPDDVFLFNYSKHELDNRSRQLNPNNDEYWRSRGYDEKPTDWEYRTYDYSKDERDNRSNQLNPNNDSYWKSRGRD
jgi:hypothetical protein